MAWIHLQQLADIFLGIFEEHTYDGRCDVAIGSLSLEDAYEVQRRVIAARDAKGERAVADKVGCTSRAIRRQFGLAEPICGRLMARTSTTATPPSIGTPTINPPSSRSSCWSWAET